MKVIEKDQKEVICPINGKFAWRDRSGEYYDPKLMNSKHVFYVMLMIWNHAAPKHHQIWANHAYCFPDMYTPSYMLNAFHVMFSEAVKRRDLGPKMKDVIEKIFSIHLNYQKYLADKEKVNGNQISNSGKEIN